MKKKGFTLIELLAVIILLGLLTFVVMPSVIGFIKEAKEKSYQQQLSNLKESAIRYVSDHTDIIDEIEENGKYNISVNDLITNGYVRKTKDGKIYNPINKEEINGCFVVENSGQYNQLTYTYMESCN